MTTKQFRASLVRFEKELERRMPEFNCSVHLCLGQEQVPSILHAFIQKQDWLFSTHRSHGHYLAKGGFEAKILDEIEGKESGVNGGYSGSQSFCDTDLNFHSTAIVGGLIGAATGAALALKLKESTAMVVCCVGDGATEQGVFWEAINFSALHKLPLLFVCENNGLSVHAPLNLRQSSPLKQRVRAFGLRTFSGIGGLTAALRKRHSGFVEIKVKRNCAHVSAMEDLRE